MATCWTQRKIDFMDSGYKARPAEDINAGAPADLIRNSMPSIGDYGTGYGGRKRAGIAIAVAIIIVVSAAYFFYRGIGTGTGPASTASTTYVSTYSSTINNSALQWINATAPQLDYFVYSYKFDFGTNSSQAYEHYNPQCDYMQYYRIFGNGVPVTNASINYSSLNIGEPFEMFLSIKIINSSNFTSYIGMRKANNGYCNRLTGEFAKNSNFSSYNQSYAGIQGHLLLFNNFTARGLNISDTYYTGAVPRISLLESSVIYKNAEISVQEWGFAGHMNQSAVIQDTNSMLEAFIAKFP